ncbi:MAG: signal recognition particle-docking protein FtsY [Candidatus Diapherotrites archaeon CG09_land_8_20_14_0_10_32_12]|nr:MAG: signal recognition particle-docking protein FtsY [Candidatus Diapherotrites archaeon CG09_land_8_20_14_0_10_32_12]
MFKLLKSAFSKVADVLKSKKESIEKPEVIKAPPLEESKQEIKPKVEIEESVPINKVPPIHKEKEIVSAPSFKTKLKSLFSEKIYLSENDLKDIKEKFEIVLLQSDFSVEILDSILDNFIAKLKSGIEKKKNMDAEIKEKFLETLFELVTLDKNILFSTQSKPAKILFVGPNGCGKTTTIAKLARMIIDNKKSVVMAAGDTFRAASIEQLKEHANNLKVPIIAGNYGSDPTSIAFDAVTFAKNKNIDYVLIDTAGRQETNPSLMNELKKMKRVINPDMVIYVAESIAGQAVVNQVKEFEKEIGVNAFIITKADVDTKGGTAFSLNIYFKKPILFLGTGQGYNDLVLFEKDNIGNLFE